MGGEGDLGCARRKDWRKLVRLALGVFLKICQNSRKEAIVTILYPWERRDTMRERAPEAIDKS